MACGNRGYGKVTVGRAQRPSLSNTDLILCSAEDTAGGCLLFQHLLLVGVGEANLDEMLFAARLRHRGVVELLDDIVTDVTGFEAGGGQQCEIRDRGCHDLPSKANATTSAGRVSEYPARTHLVRCEDGSEFMLVHVLWDVGHVKIGVALVGELLELGVEGFLKRVRQVAIDSWTVGTYPSKADFISKIVEATDAVFSILKVVVLDEAESAIKSQPREPT